MQEGGYTIIIQKVKKMATSEESIQTSFKIGYYWRVNTTRFSLPLRTLIDLPLIIPIDNNGYDLNRMSTLECLNFNNEISYLLFLYRHGLKN